MVSQTQSQRQRRDTGGFSHIFLPAEPLQESMHYLNDTAVYIQEKNCLKFIIDPLKLSQEEVYQTISGVDEGLSLLSKDIIIEDLEWTNKKNYLMRPAFISMLYPEILKLHFEAITSGISIILDFDKISSLEDMNKYMMCVECLYSHEEYPSDLNIDYNSREEALQAYTEASKELCRSMCRRRKSSATVSYCDDFSICRLLRHY